MANLIWWHTKLKHITRFTQVRHVPGSTLFICPGITFLANNHRPNNVPKVKPNPNPPLQSIGMISLNLTISFKQMLSEVGKKIYQGAWATQVNHVKEFNTQVCTYILKSWWSLKTQTSFKTTAHSCFGLYTRNVLIKPN